MWKIPSFCDILLTVAIDQLKLCLFFSILLFKGDKQINALHLLFKVFNFQIHHFFCISNYSSLCFVIFNFILYSFFKVFWNIHSFKLIFKLNREVIMWSQYLISKLRKFWNLGLNLLYLRMKIWLIWLFIFWLQLHSLKFLSGFSWWFCFLIYRVQILLMLFQLLVFSNFSLLFFIKSFYLGKFW